MGIAYIGSQLEGVGVVAQQQTTGQDLTLCAKEITCGFIEGTVTCCYDGEPVGGAIIKVFDAEDNHYFGITDCNGDYRICVPEGTYTIQVYCCPDGCCEDVECEPCCGADCGSPGIASCND